ncbi:hypothetical protein BDQ17DRAFT_1463342 [Cyathus striatus]|nr:hypothetical protein BDQ17DRAFT_1463342 [Cyathus striatus]
MAPNKKNNTNNTSTTVSPPCSHSGQVHSDPPVSKLCKHAQSVVDTTVKPAAKKPTINSDGLDVKKNENKIAANKEKKMKLPLPLKRVAEMIIKEIGLTVAPPACVITTETTGTTTEATAAAGVAIEAATTVVEGRRHESPFEGACALEYE